MINTPNSNVYSHLVFNLSCTGEATYLVTEGSDRNAGTSLNTLNRRRIGIPNVSTITVSRTPVGGSTDGVIIIFSKRLGITGTGSKSIEGADVKSTNEWILKPNTKYVISITTYASVYVTCQLDWYELSE